MDTEPKESSDLLDKDNKSQINCNACQETNSGPPDGGLRAYMVVLGSFLTNGLLFGFINSYSGIYIVLRDKLKEQGDLHADSSAALVGSLTLGTTFLLSPLSGVLTGLLGLRLTAVLGGSIATAGLLLSSFFAYNANVLYFTYGIMYGLGASFAYTPSLAILGHYFQKHLGIVNGLVTVGSSVFTDLMPYLIDYMLKNYDLASLFRVVSMFTVGIALCGLLYKPTPLMILQKPSRRDNSFKSLLKSIINVEIYKNKKYRMWALSMPVALFGYFVPYVHMKLFTETIFPDKNSYLPIQCIAFTSGVGRILFGFLADKRGVDRILLQQISFYAIGTLTIILPFVRSYELLIAITLGMGIFDGAFIALIGPIAFELCASAHAAQAIGCMLGLAAVPLCIGPTVAGYLYNINNSYTLPFVLAGTSPLIGATLMFTIRFFRNNQNQGNEVLSNGHVIPLNSNIGKNSQTLDYEKDTNVTL